MDDSRSEEQTCPHCSQPIEDPEEKRFCPQCGAMYHAACWQASGGRCGTPACAEAAEVASEQPPSAPEETAGGLRPREEATEESSSESRDEGPPLYSRAEAAIPEPVPLEDRAHYGFFRGLWKTWSEAGFNPHAFFPKVQCTQDIGWPILFVFLFVGITTGISFMEWALLEGIAVQAPDLPMPRELARQAAIAYGIMGLLAPIGVIVFFLLRTLVLHLLLMILGGARNGLVMTLRALAYAQAPGLFAIVPCCGVVIWQFWALVLEILGLAEVHETDIWRSALAVLLPTFLCCLGLVGMFALGWGAFMQGLQQAGFPFPSPR